MHPSPSPSPARHAALLRGTLVVSVVLVVYHLVTLILRWQEWRAGTPDQYPGQHRGLFLGTVSGLALTLALPVPLLMMRIGRERRAPRAALWLGWAVCMAVAVYTLWLQR